MAESEAKTEL